MAQVVDDQALIREAFDLLFAHMGPSKVAQLLSALGGGRNGGDYMAWRDRHFAEKSVDDLMREMRSSRPDSKPESK